MARPAGLILDYGNVLTHPRDETWTDRAARRLGAGRAAFRAAYWQHRHAYDADLPAAEYWRRVLAASRPGGGAPDAAELAWLIAADVASWRVYHDEVWALAAAFRAAGGRTGFLSNNGPEVMARVRADHPLEARFDAVVISCESASPSPTPDLPARPGAPRPARRRHPLRGRSRGQRGGRRAGRAAGLPVRRRRRARAVAGPGRLSHLAPGVRPRWVCPSPTWAIPFWAWRKASRRNHCGAR